MSGSTPVISPTAATPLVVSAQAARAAAARLATSSTAVRDRALREMASALRAAQESVLAANALDVEAQRAQGAPAALLDRLVLTPARVEAMAASLEEVAALPDPLGEGVAWTRPNGLQIERVRVPLGVLAIIYEARPNVTVEAASLAFKAGNAVLLRGSSHALESNRCLAALLTRSLEAAGLPPAAITLIDSPDRDVVDELVRLNGLVDVVIPRGSSSLIQRVIQTATVPVIETGVGNCHVYVDEHADLAKAQAIILNAKVQRPAVCNAAESLLVHRAVASTFLVQAGAALTAHGVELRGCETTRELIAQALPATDEDYATEFHALVLAVKVVDSLEAAMEHINRYSSRHSEAIVTQDYSRAQRFAQEVDAAAVYLNASTRFTDGGEFGFGGEMGISTQKLHARGPLGVRELTTQKYVVRGDGHCR
jgi:glutamate-5-semialdehyde dehydrogenase